MKKKVELKVQYLIFPMRKNDVCFFNKIGYTGLI